jgi:Flp pilus assembly pilin Flp
MHAAACLCRLARDERGATIVEYGLMVALIAFAIVVWLRDIGSSTSENIGSAASQIENG